MFTLSQRLTELQGNVHEWREKRALHEKSKKKNKQYVRGAILFFRKLFFIQDIQENASSILSLLPSPSKKFNVEESVFDKFLS